MDTNCLNLLIKLNNDIYENNNELIKYMLHTNYNVACTSNGVYFENYFLTLKSKWELTINEFTKNSNRCHNIISKATNSVNIGKTIYDLTKKPNTGGNMISKAKNTIAIANTIYDFKKMDLIKELEKSMISLIKKQIQNTNNTNNFIMEKNAIHVIKDLSKILFHHCQCKTLEIFNFILSKYSKRLKSIDEKSIKTFFDTLSKFISDFSGSKIDYNYFNIINNIRNKITEIYSFSIESELDKLIPSELGSLKDFFTKIISTYYNNLHPIIWSQIFMKIIENFFIDLPITQSEIFSFFSKYLLLNSGPFILKILQMIRPVLTPELAKKYNLTKLTYPLLTNDQVDTILNDSIINWELYKIDANFSASVGHVVRAKQELKDGSTKIIMIKIIKPLSIAQSCWEYSILNELFPQGTCEQKFVNNMLESNGKELNVENEKINLDTGHKLYKASYNDIFGKNVKAKLTTIQHVPGVVKQDKWFVLAMTLASGFPLSKLIEDDLIEKDTIFRSKIHRCLDILVYKFFFNIVANGFYHGDLHSGNIFFSFKKSKITLIDFGAVGFIDLYDNNPEINSLLSIMIMASFYNYVGVLDEMTDLLNSKCESNIINKNDKEYINFIKKMKEYQYLNMKYDDIEKQNEKIYESDIFSDERLKQESAYKIDEEKKIINTNSIYASLSKKNNEETIVENRDVIPVTPRENKSKSVFFNKILEEIIKYYASSGVNIAVKLNDFYELQKAYALLIGVLDKVHYSEYRANIIIRKAIINIKNIPKLSHFKTVIHISAIYLREKRIFNSYKNEIYESYAKYKKYQKKYNNLINQLP